MQRSDPVLSPSERLWDFASVSPYTIDPQLSEQAYQAMISPSGKVPEDLAFLDQLLIDESAEPDLPPPGSESSTERLYLRARVLEKQREYSQAAQFYGQALALDPNQADLMRAYAETLYRSGRRQQAFAWMLRLHLADEAGSTVYTMIGDYCRAANQDERAVALYRRALRCADASETNPRMLLIHLKLAAGLEELGYLAAATESYESAWRLAREHRMFAQTDAQVGAIIRRFHDPLVRLAGAYLQLGDVRTALLTLDRIQGRRSLEIVAFFVQSTLTLSLSRELRHKRIEVLLAYCLAEGMNPQATVEIYHNACAQLAYGQDYPEGLLRWFERDRLIDARTLAYGLVLVDQVGQARQVLGEALKRRSTPDDWYLDLAGYDVRAAAWPDLYRSLARWAARTDDLCNGAFWQLVSDNAEHLAAVSTQRMKLPRQGQEILEACLAGVAGRTSAAVSGFDRVLARTPQRDDLVNLIAELLLRDSQLQVLRDRMSTRIPDSDSSESVLQDHLIWRLAQAELEQGEYEAAGKRLVGLISRYPRQGKIVLALARCRLLSGELETARQILLDLLDHPRLAADNSLTQSCLSENSGGSGSPHDLSELVMRGWEQLVEVYAVWLTQPQVNPEHARQIERQAERAVQQWMIHLREYYSRTGRSGREVITQALQQRLEALHKTYPETYFLSKFLSLIHATRQNYAAAQSEIDLVLKRDPNHVDALKLAVELSLRSNEWVHAGDYQMRLWRQHPEQEVFLIDALASYRFGKQYRSARQTVESAHGLFTDLAPELRERLLAETVRLVKVSRDYSYGESIMRRWSRAEPNEPEALGASRSAAGELLLWSITQQEDYERAFYYAQELYANDPDLRPRMALRLYHRLFWSGSQLPAKELLEFLRSVRSDDLGVRTESVLFYAYSGMIDAAVSLAQEYEEAAGDPNEVNHFRQVTLAVLQRAGRLDQVQAHLDRWAQDDFSPSLPGWRVDHLLRKGDFEQAKRVLTEIESNESEHGAMLLLEATVRYHVARQSCEQLRDALPGLVPVRESPESLVNQSQYLARCGLHDVAIAQTRRVLGQLSVPSVRSRLSPLSVQLMLSGLLDTAGQSEESVDLLRQLVVEQPDSAVTLNNLAYQLTELGREPNYCGDLLERSYRLDPDSSATLDSLGWFHYKKGNYTLAQTYLLEALELSADPDAEMLDHLGDLYYRLGEIEHAGFLWQQASERLSADSLFDRRLKKRLRSIAEKLQQLQSDRPVAVAPLFNEQALSGQREAVSSESAGQVLPLERH